MTARARRFIRLPSRLRGRSGLTVTGAAIFTLLIGATIGYMGTNRARADEAIYTIDGEETPFTMPLKLPGAPSGSIVVRFILDLPEVHPTSFHIVPDDCLEALEINGENVDDPRLPLCDFTEGAVFDLSAYLHEGDNAVIARVDNGGGDAQLLFQPSWGDRTVLIPWMLLGAWILGLGSFLLLRIKPVPWIATLSLLFLASAFVRGYYLLSTPYWIRGHDTDGHIEYIEYIAENVRLPAPNEGWEYWQPPLYYAIGAVWAKTADILGLARQDMLFGVQVLSYLLSLAMLGCVAWAGIRLFPEQKERTAALPLFFALIAFFPGLIYLSARINNDVLAVAFAFAAVGALLEWWRSGERRWWIALMLAIALHVLTKSNGLLLLPVAYACLLLRRGTPWKKRLTEGLLGILIVAVVAGWFNVYRLTQNDEQDLIIGNTATLNSGLAVTNDIAAFTVFNPIEMMRIPYNNPWDDAARRNYFWEYWYRSAFFGEFHFGDDRKLLASWILGASFLVLLVAAAGFARSLRDRFYSTLPMLILGVTLSLGHAFFRFRYPYGSSQDFRYSLAVLFPWALFAALGVVLYRSAAWRMTATYVIHAFIAFCVAFLLHP